MSQSFVMSSVNAININLGAGNDTIMVSSGVPAVSINGGAGDDKLMAENTAWIPLPAVAARIPSWAAALAARSWARPAMT